MSVKTWIKGLWSDSVYWWKKLAPKTKVDIEHFEEEVKQDLPQIEATCVSMLPVIEKVLKGEKMNPLSIVQMILSLLPYVEAGVAVIHQGASTETKAQLTQQILGIAVAGATQTGVLGATNSGLAAGIGTAAAGIIGAATGTAPVVIPPPTTPPAASPALVSR